MFIDGTGPRFTTNVQSRTTQVQHGRLAKASAQVV